MSNNDGLVAALRDARRTGRRLETLDDSIRPATIEDAYAAAERVFGADTPRSGFKIGATNAGGQAFLGLEEPFFGRIRTDLDFSAPVTLETSDEAVELEPEIGFIVGDPPGVPAEPLTAASIVDHVAAVVPVIEINRPSFERPFDVGGLALIADNGVNAGIVRGQPRSVDTVTDFAGISVSLRLDGDLVEEGSSSAVLGDPLEALAWLANALPARGLVLGTGEIVASGAMTRSIRVGPGQQAVADFGPLGRVSVNVSKP